MMYLNFIDEKEESRLPSYTVEAMDEGSLRKVNLMGTLQIQVGQDLQPLNGEKLQTLLAFLLLFPDRPHRREQLADILFPDAPFERVRRNLSDALYRLQKTLGSDWLKVETETIALRRTDGMWVDVWEFDRLATSSDLSELRKAIELYKGDLLSACYDDWILPEREVRRNQYLFALENLAAHQEASGQLAEALLTARRLILAEPLHEPAHQAYLRLLGRLHRYGEAMAHYEFLSHLLQRELEVVPLVETQQIIRSLEEERTFISAAMPQERLPFVGRAVERADVLAAVETALQGRGGIIAVEGEAGIGKSRFLREIAAGARWRGATVLESVASEIPEASPYAPLARALNPFLSGLHATQFGSLLPPDVLATLAPLYPPWQRYTSSHRSFLDQDNRHFNNALRVFGDVLTRLAPVILILDDLQWASPALWESLQILAQSLTQNGALLVLAYRRPEIEKTIGWDKLQVWDRSGELKIIPLQPLTVEEVGLLLGDRKNDDPAVIHALTGGSPFRLSEWSENPDKLQGSSEPLIEQWIFQRLNEVSTSAREALAYASVLGENISFALWSRMLEMSPLALASLSEELVSRRWLLPSLEGFIFAHDLIRTAIYNEIPPHRLGILHTQAARVYQAQEPDNARSFAFHLDRAGFTTEAAVAYVRAGEQNRQWFAYREAQIAFERALELTPVELVSDRIEIALQLAAVCEITGDRHVQRRALDESVAGARKPGSYRQLLKAYLIQGHASSTMNQFVDAEKNFKQALALARRLGDRASEGRARYDLGLNSNRRFQPIQAQRYFTQALKLARKIPDRNLEGQALSGLGITTVDLGLPQEAVQWLNQALIVHRENGDFLGEVRTQMYLSSAFYHLGAWDRLIGTATEALSNYEKMGNRHTTAYLRQLLGLAFYSLGDATNARHLLDQAEQDYLAVNDQQAAGLARNVLGLVAENEGHFQDALQLYQTALDSAKALEAPNETALAKIDLGALLLRMDQPIQAIPYLESANIICEEHNFRILLAKCEALLGLGYRAVGDSRAEELAERGWAAFQVCVPIGEQPQGWLWALFRLLSIFDHPAQANDVLQAAYNELQRQARAIRDSDLRRSFFERVTLNRDIMKAYDEYAHLTRVIPVLLACREAPLGRTLRDDEMVTVKWTVNAPEDEAIGDKSELRQHRLKRLFREADLQGASPTDDDLASALGVSRRTILRDMQTLSEEIPRPPTRKRRN